MKLYCVRHGHAETQPDASGDYPLTAEGKDEVSRVAAYLARRGVHVAHVMHSGKLRAQQSAELLANSLTNSRVIEVCPLLCSGHPVAPLIELIQGWNDDTLLVGHMPFMSQFVSTLVIGDERYEMVRFPPGTVVCLDRYEHHRWILDWVMRPDLVPDQGN